MKNCVRYFLILAVSALLSICAYAENPPLNEEEDSVKRVIVNEQSSEVRLGETSTVSYHISFDGFKPEIGCSVSVEWDANVLNGLEWEMSGDLSVLTVKCDESIAASGRYGFSLVVDGITSDMAWLIVSPHIIEKPKSYYEFEYSSKYICPIEYTDNLVLDGDFSMCRAGEYSMTAFLEDTANCCWSDGSVDPVYISWKIMPKAVDISGITVVSKECDGTNNVELDCSAAVFSGLIEGDVLSCVAEGRFDSPKVGSGKPVTFSTYLIGESSENYYISENSQSTAVGIIYKAKSSGQTVIKNATNDNYCNGRVNSSEEDFADSVLDTNDKALIKNGADLRIWLSVTDMTNLECKSDAARVDEIKGDSTVAAYMDINLYKQYGDNETAVSVPEISNSITIELKVPKDYLCKDKKLQRTFGVYHVHNGNAVQVESTYDEKTNTLSFSTDSFSTYALFYKDEQRITKRDRMTSDDGNYLVLEVILIILLISNICYFALVYEKKKQMNMPVYSGRHAF